MTLLVAPLSASTSRQLGPTLDWWLITGCGLVVILLGLVSTIARANALAVRVARPPADPPDGRPPGERAGHLLPAADRSEK